MSSDARIAREWAEWVKDNPGVYGGTSYHARAAADLISSLPDEWVDVNNLRELLDKWAANPFPTSDEVAVLNDVEALLPAPTPPTLADMTPEERQSRVGMWCENLTSTAKEPALVVLSGVQGDLCWVLHTDLHGERSCFPLDRVAPRPDLMRAWNPDGEPEADDTREPEQAPTHPTELVTVEDYETAPHGTVVWGDAPASKGPTSLEKWNDLWHESGVMAPYREVVMAEYSPHQVLRWGDAQ